MTMSSLRWWRPALVGLTIGTLLLPGSRLPSFVYPLTFGVPLAWAGFRRGESRAFRLWTAYGLGFVLFGLLRAHADEPGFPVRRWYPIAVDGELGPIHQPGSKSISDPLCSFGPQASCT
jgi:hypothetical protein